MSQPFASVPSIAASILCCAVSLNAAAEPVDLKRQYNLPPGDAETMLPKFANASGRQIIFMMDKVRGEKTNAIAGQYTPREALERMLEKTVLSASEDQATGAFVVVRMAEPEQGPRPEREGTRSPTETNRKTMNKVTLITRVTAWLAVLSASSLDAQTAATQPSETASEEMVVLSPFEVHASKDTGYVAGSSLAGGRADTPLKLTAASISVMTREFLDDLNINSMEEAVSWSVNVTPGQEKPYEAPFGTFQYNFRNTGGSGNFPTRNYFLFYANADGYNAERFEFSRGPNSLLFGDAGLGGVATNFTKQARLNVKRHEVRLSADTFGGRRASFDTQLGFDRFGLRVNAVTQRNEGWRDGAIDERDGVHVAATWKVAEKTQVRAEYERMDWKQFNYSGVYLDRSSFWDRTTVNENNTAIASPGNYGLGTFATSTTPYLVFAPAVPSAGVLDWRNSYRTDGTGFSMSTTPREGIDRFPTLPSREFNLGPIDSYGIRELESATIYVDQRITDDWFAQFAYFRMSHPAYTENTESRATEYRIDVNRLLPNGQPNPKFGVPYTDVDQQEQLQANAVEDYRLLTTYKFEAPSLWNLKQRFSLIGGYRPERFNMYQARMRWVNNPAQPNLNHAANQVRYRYYWDEPMTYGIGNEGPAVGDMKFEMVPLGYCSDERKKLTYAQVVSSTTLFKDRVSIIAGARRDQMDRSVIQTIGNHPQTGRVIFGGFDPAQQKNVVDYVQENNVKVTSTNVGSVVYVFPWLAFQANYSENFGLPTSGPNKINGEGFDPSRGSGYDFGIKFSLPNNKLYAVVSRYDTEQTGRIENGQRQTDIRNIWKDLGSTDTALTQMDYRDTSDIQAEGWEAEIVANPTPNFRLTANWAKPDQTIIESMPGLRRYFEANVAAWQAGAAALPESQSTQKARIGSSIDNLRNYLDGIVTGAQAQGTYKSITNFYGTYSFTDGWVKGVSVGAGGQYRGKRKVGSRDAQLKFATTNPTPAQNVAAAFDYLYAPETFSANMHVSYECRFSRKVRARFQVNVSNLLNTNEPRPISYGIVSASATRPRTQGVNNFAFPDPRKITFTTTFTF